jgi:uncharacterized protein (DUF427 family)
MNNTNSWKDNQGIAPVPGHDEALSDVLREMRSDPHPSRRFVHVLADRIEAALARQEAVEDDIIAAAELRGYRRRQEEEVAQEPVAWYLPSEDIYDSCFRDHRTITSCTSNPWAGWIPLYAAPPAAQAIDLEQFREAVEYWLNTGGGGCFDVTKDEARRIVPEAERLLSIIDQNTGKGIA